MIFCSAILIKQNPTNLETIREIFGDLTRNLHWTAFTFSWKCCLQRINPCSVISDRWCAEDWFVWTPRAVGGIWQTSRPTGAELLYSSPISLHTLLCFYNWWDSSWVPTVHLKCFYTFSSNQCHQQIMGLFLAQTAKNREERSCTLFTEVIWIVWQHTCESNRLILLCSILKAYLYLLY